MSSAGNRRGAREGRSTAQVYLARRQVAVQYADGVLWKRSTADVAESLSALSEELGRHDGSSTDQPPIRRLHVWLGASLCRPARLAAVAGALSASERRSVGEAAAVAQAGLPPPCRVWLDVATTSQSRLAVVVEQSVLDGLDAVAVACRARLVSVRPFWAEVLRWALLERPTIEAIAVWEGGALTLLAGAGDTFSVARTSVPVNDAASANAAFLRTGVAEGLALGNSLAIALDLDGGSAPGLWTEADRAIEELPFGAWLAPLEARS